MADAIVQCARNELCSLAAGMLGQSESNQVLCQRVLRQTAANESAIRSSEKTPVCADAKASGAGEAQTMNTEDTARVGTLVPSEPYGAHPSWLLSQRVATVLALAICWWSLIEFPLELGMGDRATWVVAAVVVRLIEIVLGLAVVIDVRFARTVFSFLCGVSVLAIAPRLPLELHRSIAVSLVLLVECVGKAAFVLSNGNVVGSMCVRPEEARLPGGFR